jgi:crotonobetainyl-CoA:carnitine CoA-transferase CaiB-like acyl-CoA transferase
MRGVDKAIRTPAQAAPENTEEVLAELGYSAADIAAMREAGAI